MPQSLGCLILAVMFSLERRETELYLERGDDSIQRIVFDFSGLDVDFDHPGLHLQPIRYGYYPSEIKNNPGWSLSEKWGIEAPWFEITNQSRCVTSEEERMARDTVVMAGSGVGIARFAELCLNLGRPNCAVSEYVLECPLVGFGGVAPGSAEMRLLLPGARTWSVSGITLDED